MSFLCIFHQVGMRMLRVVLLQLAELLFLVKGQLHLAGHLALSRELLYSAAALHACWRPGPLSGFPTAREANPRAGISRDFPALRELSGAGATTSKLALEQRVRYRTGPTPSRRQRRAPKSTYLNLSARVYPQRLNNYIG